MTTGELIKAERQSAGLTQEELAKRLGVPYQSVSQWERGTRKPKIETLKRIAVALDVNLISLVPADKQLETAVAYMEEALHAIPDIPQNVEAAISEFAFAAGLESGKYRAMMKGLAPEVFEINRLLSRLNAEGKKKAIERVEELAEIPRYLASPASKTPQESGGTPPENK